MATRVDLPPMPPFDPLSDPLSDRSSLSQRWKAWNKQFETYLVATNITNEGQKQAMLLYQAGLDTQDIFDTLTETGTNYVTTKAKLNEYYSPKKNVNYKVFHYCQATQQPTESVEQFTTRLQKLSLNCEFCNVDSEIKLAINCISKCLRRFVLRENELTLDALLTKARSLKMSEIQATSMEEKLHMDHKQPPGDVNLIKGHHKRQSWPSPFSHKQDNHPRSQHTPQPSTTCHKYGKSWPHKQSLCQKTDEHAASAGNQITLPKCA